MIRFERINKKEYCLVKIQGEVSGDASQNLLSELESVEKSSPLAIILDLSRVEYMDSSGVGVLIRIFKRMREKNAGFAIVGLNRKLSEVFEVTRLDRVFDFYASLRDYESMRAAAHAPKP